MRYQSIPSSLFVDRRNEFAKKMASGSVAIFCSNDLMPRSGDQFFPFRQDSALFALSGLDQQGSIIVLYPDAKKKSNREMAFILPHDPEHLIWHGERYSEKQASAVSGISTIYTIDQWDRIMPSLLGSATIIYTHPRQEDRSETEVKTQNDRMNEKLKQLYPVHNILSAQAILTRMLMVKHPVELDMMRKAVQVTGRAFESILHDIRPGMLEYEVEARLSYEISRHGCQHAFEPIVASGGSACTLHYVQNDKMIGKEDLVLIDFGAEYACMASDMTRTIPASGRFSKRQKSIYTSVLNVLNEITGLMRPGVMLSDLNKEAGQLIERELVKLKIVSNRDLRRQDTANPLRKKYFMHGIGHHLGYDVHDISDRRASLKAGMVITCEPGLYIPEEQIGIRLENDILITRGKPKNLMADIPIEPEEIESLMNA